MQAQRSSYERGPPASPARDIHATRPLDRIPDYAAPASISTDAARPTMAMYEDETPHKPMQIHEPLLPRTALGMLNLPNANRSTSSLMDAVFGGEADSRPSPSTPAAVPTPAYRAPPQSYIPPRNNPGPAPSSGVAGAPGISPLQAGRPVRRRSARDPRRSGKAESSRRGSNSNTETTDSWDKMSDADSARVYEEGAEEGGEGEVDQEKVQELERTVNKRKSVLPALESELAALNERIREAEERLARAQAGKVATA